MDKNQLRAELLNVTVYKCYHCSGILGVTTDNFLFIGTVRFSRHQTFDCTICDKGNFWKPKEEIIKKNK